MGKYRKYKKLQKRGKRVTRRILLLLGLVLALLYTALTFNVSIPVAGDFITYSVDGERALNITLFRARYVGRPETGAKTIRVYVDEDFIEFGIPEGKEGTAIYLGTSKLVTVKGEEVQPKVKIPLDDDYRNYVVYPGPPLKTSALGRSEDYIITQFPLELHFVFTVLLCNVTVRAKLLGASPDSLEIEFVSKEGAPAERESLRCDGELCETRLKSQCVLSYNLSAKFTYLGVIKLRHINGRTRLELIDNLWIPSVLYVITMMVLYTAVKKLRSR